MNKTLEEVNKELSELIKETKRLVLSDQREKARISRDKVLDLYIYKKKNFGLDKDEKKALKIIKKLKSVENFKPFQNMLRKRIQSKVKQR